MISLGFVHRLFYHPMIIWADEYLKNRCPVFQGCLKTVVRCTLKHSSCSYWSLKDHFLTCFQCVMGDTFKGFSEDNMRPQQSEFDKCIFAQNECCGFCPPLYSKEILFEYTCFTVSVFRFSRWVCFLFLFQFMYSFGSLPPAHASLSTYSADSADHSSFILAKQEKF